MTPDERTLDAAVSAFRAQTEADADGEPTRLRVVAAVVRRDRRRAVLRRAFAGAVTVLVLLTTGSAAWTAIGWWRGHTPARTQIAAVGAATPAASIARPHRIIPAVHAPAPVDDEGADRIEAAAYRRAHRAHFVDNLPARALADWDAYLASYPRGAFAPEARFNRALCLVRLARWSDAARALGAFVRGRNDGYRRGEACALLAWMRTRTDDPAIAAAACASGSIPR